METPGELFRRLLFLLRGNRFNREMEEEMRFHLEKRAASKREQGADPEEARLAAQRRFGNAALLRERTRDAWGWAWLDRLRQDVRFALRSLARTPGFSAVVVLTLAFGIGVNAAIFSAVYALILNPYPFPGAGRLVSVDEFSVNGENNTTGYLEFLDWQRQNSVFEAMAIEPWPASYTLTGLGEPRRIEGGRTTAGFWRVLGIQPAMGRFFSEQDGVFGAAPVAVITWEMWDQRFGRDPGILSRTIALEGYSVPIVGVLPRGFVYPGIPTCEFFAPLQDNGGLGRTQHQYSVLARLKPGVTLEQAQSDMSTIAARLEKLYPETNKGWGVRIRPLRDALADQVRTPVLFMSASVGFVLLLACVNVSGLLLARASGKTREVGIRAALGAGRGRIVRQMLTETVVLSLAGGAAGVVLALWMMRALRAVAPTYIGLDSALRLNPSVLVFTLAVSLATGIASGLVPAWLASGADPNSALKEEGSAPAQAWTRTRSRNRVLSILVAGEVALSVVLMTGSGLMVRSFLNGMSVDIGIRTGNVISFSIGLPDGKYTAASAANFYRELLDRLNRAPGIESAAAIGTLPMTSGMQGGAFLLDDRPKPPNWRDQMVQYNASTPGYFATMGIPVLRGRDFNAQDTATSMPVGLVNEALARQYFPGQDPIGRRYLDDYDGKWRTIVGVVGSIAHQQPTRPPMPGVYAPFSQSTSGWMWIVLHSRGNTASAIATARQVVHQLDPNLPLARVRTMRQVVSDSLLVPRLLMQFLGIFAAFALMLDAIGIYGIVDYSVRQRTHEMGIRIALGASRSAIARLMVRNGILPAAIGAVIGLPAAVALLGVLRAVLFGVSPRDATVAFGVSTLLFAVALAASLLPAQRAARVDTVVALRYE
jgi:putative ABC transport system permease protein